MALVGRVVGVVISLVHCGGWDLYLIVEFNDLTNKSILP